MSPMVDCLAEAELVLACHSRRHLMPQVFLKDITIANNQLVKPESTVKCVTLNQCSLCCTVLFILLKCFCITEVLSYLLLFPRVLLVLGGLSSRASGAPIKWMPVVPWDIVTAKGSPAGAGRRHGKSWRLPCAPEWDAAWGVCPHLQLPGQSEGEFTLAVLC